MRSKLRLRMQTLILLVLISSLLLVTVTMGALIYGNLYEVILHGFDQKLSAVSAATGAFIDGDIHDRIYQEREIAGLARDPRNGVLYGADAAGGLVRIDTGTGGAVDIGPTGFA